MKKPRDKTHEDAYKRWWNQRMAAWDIAYKKEGPMTDGWLYPSLPSLLNGDYGGEYEHNGETFPNDDHLDVRLMALKEDGGRCAATAPKNSGASTHDWNQAGNPQNGVAHSARSKKICVECDCPIKCARVVLHYADAQSGGIQGAHSFGEACKK